MPLPAPTAYRFARFGVKLLVIPLTRHGQPTVEPCINPETDSSTDDAARMLLSVLERLASELSLRTVGSRDLNLDSSLAHDLGFDSLARAELVLRIEEDFDVHLPTQALAVVESPRDLLREILRARSKGEAGRADDAVAAIQLRQVQSSPGTAQTLQEVLAWHVREHPEREHIYLYGDDEQVAEIITYERLQREAQRIADGLLQHDVEPGQPVAIMLPTCADYFFTFFGILLARAVPVPLYPPARPSQVEDHLRRQASILNTSGASLLITVPEAMQLAPLVKSLAPQLRHMRTVDDVRGAGNPVAVGRPGAGDTAFLQYTSGSTGDPKGVVLTHANLLANIRAMGAALEVSSEDVFVSWLPLYHDMGLIGAWLGSMYFSIPLVSIPPQLFLARPRLWLRAIHRHRGTISAAPNFAFELALRLPERELADLDLSSWRYAANGAEPISPRTLRRFIERFESAGFRPQAMKPVYGLAESSVGLVFPPPDREMVMDTVDRRALQENGRAVPVPADHPQAMEMVALGHPLAGHEIRIVDDTGRELPDREEGRLQFRGPSTTSGYYHNAEKTRGLFEGDWADTGDLGYIVDGDLYLTGRSKDLIIRGGRNIYPHELEDAVAQVPGIRKGCVVAFASPDPRGGTERLVLVAETHEEDPGELDRLREEVRGVVSRTLEIAADEIALVPPRNIPKTSSGKIRRSASAALYRDGHLGRKAPRAVWWQVLRLAATGVRPRLVRGAKRTADLAYAAWAWAVFAIFAPVTWLSVAALPSGAPGWRLTQVMARLLLRLIRTPLITRGTERLPADGRCVLVGNHGSYLDGLVLMAGLPSRYHFVAKGELKNHWFPRIFLSRLEVAFVERFDTEKSVADSQRLVEMARSGSPLFFFPEGTFRRMPGIFPFHLGAFKAAVEAEVPVIPVTIRGTRSKLRDGSWFPRRGAVTITVGEPISATEKGWTGSVQIRDAARAEILRVSGEPDLVESPLRE